MFITSSLHLMIIYCHVIIIRLSHYREIVLQVQKKESILRRQ